MTAATKPDGSARTFTYDSRGMLTREVVRAAGTGSADPCAGATPTITGTAGNDTLQGTKGRDVIFGLGGNDVISGGDGDDLLCGGEGDDRLDGGRGVDTLIGSSGRDTLVGGANNDTIDGGSGTDKLDAGAGNDVLQGGPDVDSLNGGLGTDGCETEPGRTGCETTLAPLTGLGSATTVERAYDGDRLLTEVTIIRPDGATDFHRLTWDRTGLVPQLISITKNGQRTDVLYGARRALAVTGSQVSAFGYDALGDNVGPAPLTVAPVYEPYGRPAGDAITVGFGYRGELHVGDLVYLRSRDLDPATGRFTVPDRLDGVPGKTTVTNRYHYADNDPVNQVDPLGLYPSDSDIGPKPTDDRSETECSATSPLDGWDISNPDAGFFERDRAQQVVARRDPIERWASANGISSFLLATLVHHEGGNYLDPWRRSAAQGRDYALLGADKAGLGSASVGIAQVQLGTARQVLAERYCGEPDWSDFELGSAMIESDEFAISIAAGYLRLLRNDYPTAGDRGLFIAYAASRTSNRIMESFSWDLQRLARAAAADYYVQGRFSVMVDGELLAMSASTLNTLLAREEDWESSSSAMRGAGW